MRYLVCKYTKSFSWPIILTCSCYTNLSVWVTQIHEKRAHRSTCLSLLIFQLIVYGFYFSSIPLAQQQRCCPVTPDPGGGDRKRAKVMDWLVGAGFILRKQSWTFQLWKGGDQQQNQTEKFFPDYWNWSHFTRHQIKIIKNKTQTVTQYKYSFFEDSSKHIDIGRGSYLRYNLPQ